MLYQIQDFYKLILNKISKLLEKLPGFGLKVLTLGIIQLKKTAHFLPKAE